ncbi:unnamed protein product [Oppiella nova]|uniref:Uncharacterized protein n=1 Tax=Oppiella nova TaxID=334625 RepID=A0A7R9M185_9ACAR|nr:unnamed protein product [Oppiella nova]CAG2168359.1 unnamed protein product [Oppiella nova]
MVVMIDHHKRPQLTTIESMVNTSNENLMCELSVRPMIGTQVMANWSDCGYSLGIVSELTGLGGQW